MREKTRIKIDKYKDVIDELMGQHVAIGTIAKTVGIARDTLQKYYPEYKGAQGKHPKYGSKARRECECENCGEIFYIEGYQETNIFKRRSRFCSKSCSKSRKSYWLENATHYRTIALQYHDHKCVVCEENKIISIHHIDENHENNDPKNLIILCPTHHQYLHSKYKDDVQPIVDDYVSRRWDEG